MSRSPLIAGFCLLAGMVATATAADPMAWLPADVNAVARVNVADLYKTPRAKKEGWLKQATESFVQQDTFVPPGAQQILLGAELEFTDRMTAQRKYAVLVPEEKLTLEKLVDWLPGGLQTMSGKTSAQFGEDGFVVDTGDGCWLATTQSSRQALARWLQRGPVSKGAHLPPYLHSALDARVNTGQLMLAIDLLDAFSAAQIEQSLKEAQWFTSKSSAKAIAEILAGAFGITINITVENDSTGNVALDFAKDAAPLKPILSQLVGEVLNRVGASSDDFKDWKWTVKGTRVTGTGPVSAGGGRRLLAVLEPPSLTQVMSAGSEPSNDKVAKTSLKYCNSVRVVLDDLRREMKQQKDYQATLSERSARKIDNLPTLHVDPELLDFSAKVSNSLRYQAQAKRMGLIRSGVRTQESGAYYTSSYANVSPYGGEWGFKGVDTQAADTIDLQEKSQAATVRISEWKQIEDGLVAIRRKMTQKYQIEF